MQGRCGFCRRHFKNSATYDSYVEFNPTPWLELDEWSTVSGIDFQESCGEPEDTRM